MGKKSWLRNQSARRSLTRCRCSRSSPRPDGTLIEKDCSSNWARHTWATMCAELDVPDPTISLGMGHRIAGHRTTAIYIKRDQRKVDEANRKVIDYIKESVPHLSTQDGLD